MSILNVEHLTHGFGDRAIFDDVSFRLLKGEHIGLVGANGEGKSTFMSIVTGKLTPDEGKVEWAKNVRAGYLDQHAVLQSGMTIQDVLKSAFDPLLQKEQRMNEICELNITTDYAIRIVYYLALQKENVTASELASVLKIPVSYISKITKKLKAAGIVQACEGIKGGYALVKNPEIISLFDIVSSMEVTMKINRCLESDGFCSRNATDYCNVHKALLKVQRTYEDALKSVSIADLI